jgi:fluoride ion exporter CrcB/FEX
MSTLGKSRGVTFGTFFASRSLLIADICAITVFSYLGVFLRVIITSRLQSNTLSSEVPIVYRHFLYNSHFAPNLLGCFIIAILFNLKRNILALAPMALYTGMTTGFCGSLTTFSSWAYSIAQDMFSAGVSASTVLMRSTFPLSD